MSLEELISMALADASMRRVSLRNCGCDHGDGDGELGCDKLSRGIWVATDWSRWSQTLNWASERPVEMVAVAIVLGRSRLRLKLLQRSGRPLSCVFGVRSSQVS